VINFFKENLEVSVFWCESNTQMQDRQNGNRMLRRIRECKERKRQQTAQMMSEHSRQSGNRMLRRIRESKERKWQQTAQKMSERSRQSGNRMPRRILEGKRENNGNRITYNYIIKNYSSTALVRTRTLGRPSSITRYKQQGMLPHHHA